MSVAAFLSQLRRRDIRVWADGSNLRCNAPAGALTDELREELRRHKSDIVRFLQIAETVTAQQSAIVPLQTNGKRPPIFGLGGHSGDVFCYRPLARALGEERPFFGLQPPGLDGRSEPLTRMEDLAAYFAKEIRAFRPHGPWIIAGFCSGGTLAFELAQQLLAADRSAGFLAFFGAPYPSFFRPLRLLRHRLEYRARNWRLRARLLAAQSNRERLDYVVWRLRRRPENAAPDPVTLMRAKVEQATLAALRAYEPRPFPGRLYHFLPCEAWAQHVRAERWRSVAAVDETFGPGGCDGDNMLHAQYAPVFAEHFRASCVRQGV